MNKPFWNMNTTVLCIVIANLWEIFSLIGLLPQNLVGKHEIQRGKKDGHTVCRQAKTRIFHHESETGRANLATSTVVEFPFRRTFAFFCCCSQWWLIWQAYSGSFIRNNRRGSPPHQIHFQADGSWLLHREILCLKFIVDCILYASCISFLHILNILD